MGTDTEEEEEQQEDTDTPPAAATVPLRHTPGVVVGVAMDRVISVLGVSVGAGTGLLLLIESK